MSQAAVFLYSSKGFIENKGCSVKVMNITANATNVHGHVCLVCMNCENHVGGAVDERQLSNFSLAKSFFHEIKFQYLCEGVSVCICG